MDETPLDEEAMARRVRNVGLVVVLGALFLIALSALTLKTDQVNQIPRAPAPVNAP